MIVTSAEAEPWLIHLLLTQLYDVALEVREMAVRILEAACESLDTLEAVVKMRPALDHLGYSGAPLLFRYALCFQDSVTSLFEFSFLSTSIGVRYLHEIEYIDRGLDEWFYVRCRFQHAYSTY